MTNEAEQIPYVLILDSGILEPACMYSLKAYDNSNYIYFNEPVTRSAGFAAWLGVVNSEPEQGIQTAKDKIVDQIISAIKDIEKRGYAPAAIICCPAFGQALLIDSKCPILEKYSGELTFACSTSEYYYRQNFPQLFETFPDANIPKRRNFENILLAEGLIHNAFAHAGIEPLQQVAVGGGEGIAPVRKR